MCMYQIHLAANSQWLAMMTKRMSKVYLGKYVDDVAASSQEIVPH